MHCEFNESNNYTWPHIILGSFGLIVTLINRGFDLFNNKKFGY